MLEHGGNLREAAERYSIPLSQWIDLSTGINPNGWPVPQLEPECWRRLPEKNDGLEKAAAEYYGSSSLLPVAGSQAAIQTLPLLMPQGKVGVISPGYAEHAYGWQKAGHQVELLAVDDIESRLPQLDHLVVINPNNPTGVRFDNRELQGWAAVLSKRNGYLLVDEAFMDSRQELSLVPQTPQPGLVVLRSLGKFFGLAGLRVGFVFAQQKILNDLQDKLGPWTVSGPARESARMVLLDKSWQEANRQRLQQQGERLKTLLITSGLKPSGGTDLFQWIQHPQALRLQQQFAELGIWIRLFQQPLSLRFGLPGDEPAWHRFAAALEKIDV